jgi:hypothetical protein
LLLCSWSLFQSFRSWTRCDCLALTTRSLSDLSVPFAHHLDQDLLKTVYPASICKISTLVSLNFAGCMRVSGAYWRNLGLVWVSRRFRLAMRPSKTSFAIVQNENSIELKCKGYISFTKLGVHPIRIIWR